MGGRGGLVRGGLRRTRTLPARGRRRSAAMRGGRQAGGR
jgi:hypothetical protein